MPGRGKTPVQQAWDYAIDVPGAKWVLVSNCLEIRLYGFGRGRDAYELFDLTRLDDPEELHGCCCSCPRSGFLAATPSSCFAIPTSAESHHRRSLRPL